ncbi:MAG: NAD(P)H-binding protein [bacterium]|nr:NAD(P)H-binding protein [bacterium]
MQEQTPIDIVVTGANGAIGKHLIQWLSREGGTIPTRLRALVRDLGRAAALRPLSAEILAVDYGDKDQIRRQIEGADTIVHLAGALRPKAGETLLDANFKSTQNVVLATLEAGIKNIIYLSFIGADPESRNLYIRSKGLAEQAIQSADLGGAIFRVPMVLGSEGAALAGLKRAAGASFVPLVKGGNFRIQPVSQNDVIAAIEWAILNPTRPLQIVNLPGPDTLTFADLIRRAGSRLGKNPKIIPIPRPIAWLSAVCCSSIIPSIGWNHTVYDTLFNEHLADAEEIKNTLPFALTPIAETLAHCLPPRS